MINANSKNKGFTLVEAIIALVILFIAVFISLRFMSYYVKQNFENYLCIEALNIAQSYAAKVRAEKSCSGSRNETLTIHSFNKTFSVALEDLPNSLCKIKVENIEMTIGY